MQSRDRENVDNLYRQRRQDAGVSFGERCAAAAAETTGGLHQQLQFSHHPDCGPEGKRRDPAGPERIAVGLAVAPGVLAVPQPGFHAGHRPRTRPLFRFLRRNWAEVLLPAAVGVIVWLAFHYR